MAKNTFDFQIRVISAVGANVGYLRHAGDDGGHHRDLAGAVLEGVFYFFIGRLGQTPGNAVKV